MFIEGYAAVFNTVDRNNEIILPGAFLFGEGVKCLFMHQQHNPIGEVLAIKSDKYGLRILVRIIRREEVSEFIEKKLVGYFSVGFRVIDAYYQDKIRIIESAELLEVSLVTIPAQPLAKIDKITLI